MWLYFGELRVLKRDQGENQLKSHVSPLCQISWLTTCSLPSLNNFLWIKEAKERCSGSREFCNFFVTKTVAAAAASRLELAPEPQLTISAVAGYLLREHQQRAEQTWKQQIYHLLPIFDLNTPYWGNSGYWPIYCQVNQKPTHSWSLKGYVCRMY